MAKDRQSQDKSKQLALPLSVKLLRTLAKLSVIFYPDFLLQFSVCTADKC